MTRAKALLDRADLKRPTFPQLSETAFAPWARESYQLAIEAGYLKGALKTAKSPGSAKVLPDGYSERAEEVAERQGALAGYRLADLLKKLLP